MLPAISQSRAVTRRTVCLSNLRQWVLAVRMYADVHHGRLPYRGQGIKPTTVFNSMDDWFNAIPQFAESSPYIELVNEPAPRLIVDPPLPDLLAEGVVWIQWRAENVHIVPVFGKGALNASPRVGHLHVHVDDQPWWWADASDINTIDLAGMPPGPHRIRIELVNANHEVFPGQSETVTFTIPKGASQSHSH